MRSGSDTESESDTSAPEVWSESDRDDVDDFATPSETQKICESRIKHNLLLPYISPAMLPNFRQSCSLFVVPVCCCVFLPLIYIMKP